MVIMTATKPYRVVELFSGIGAQRMALDRARIPYEVVGICDIDPFANLSYEAIHGKTPMLGEFKDSKGRTCGDVTKIKHLPKNVDILTYSFPCTDLSVANTRGKGFKGEHSGLLWAVKDILDQAQKDNNLPRYLIMENVPQVFSEANRRDGNRWLRYLDSLGYTSKSGCLNAKDFRHTGQNRNRAFMISHLGDDCPDLPIGTGGDYVLADLLDDKVDSKYYLTKSRVAGAKKSSRKEAKRGNGVKFEPLDPHKSVARTVTTNEGHVKTSSYVDTTRCHHVGNVGGMSSYESTRRVYSKNGLCPTITTNSGGGNEAKVLEGRSTIRRLTPRETWRAQSFSRKKRDGTWDDSAFEKAQAAVVAKSKDGADITMSDRQLYAQSGNSINVNVMKEIFRKIDKFDDKGKIKKPKKSVAKTKPSAKMTKTKTPNPIKPKKSTKNVETD